MATIDQRLRVGRDLEASQGQVPGRGILLELGAGILTQIDAQHIRNDNGNTRGLPPDEEMSTYFASIGDLFEKSLCSSKSERFLSAAESFCIGAAILSACPLIPSINVAVAHFVWRGNPSFHSIDIPVHSVFLWWAIWAAITIPTAVLVSRAETKVSRERAKGRIHGFEWRFALCYSILQEVERYRTNRLDKHADKALQYWNRLLPALEGELNFSPIALKGIPSGFREINAIFQLRYLLRLPWFSLSDTTARIVKAMDSLPLKVTGRLRDKKELREVASALRYFSGYLYYSIPVIANSDNWSSQEVQRLGVSNLEQFADIIEALPDYESEPKPLHGKEKVRSKFVTIISNGMDLFSHENLLLRFAVWWVSTEAALLLLSFILWHYLIIPKLPSLRVDSTLVAAWVSIVLGTPFLVAAAALAANRLSSDKAS